MLAYGDNVDRIVRPEKLNKESELLKIISQKQLGTLKADLGSWYFLTWDCGRLISQPIMASSFISTSCEANVKPRDIRTSNEMLFQLLHKTNIKRHKAIKCSLRRTMATYYCGNYHHITTYLHEDHAYTLRPVTLSTRECERLHKTGQYTDYAGAIRT